LLLPPFSEFSYFFPAENKISSHHYFANQKVGKGGSMNAQKVFGETSKIGLNGDLLTNGF
jgi:hypothetical protein